jgi:hypothetical protein
MSLWVLTDIATFRDYLRLEEIPPSGPPEWRYHDLWTLDEPALLQQRRDLGAQGRALVEWYRHAEDDETREELVRELRPLYNRRQGIVRELGRRDQNAVFIALTTQDFPHVLQQNWAEGNREIERRREESRAALAEMHATINQSADERRRMREDREAEEELAEWSARMREASEAEAREMDREWARNPVVGFMASLGNLISGHNQAPEEVQEPPGAPNEPAAAVETSAPAVDLISNEDASRTLLPVGRVPVRVSQGQMEVTYAII